MSERAVTGGHGGGLTDARRRLRASVIRSLLLAPAGPLARVEVLDRVGSTNRELIARLRAEPNAWPSPSMLVADHQDDGQGRAGRTWQTPPRAALTLSFALQPDGPISSFGWIPLLAGLGAVTALRATAGVPASLKWPNDLMVPAPDGADLAGWGRVRKVGGILSELVETSAGRVVVVGIGVNVSQAPDELPVPSGTSLALAGARAVDREIALVALVVALDELMVRWREHDGDVHAAGLAAEVASVCSTLATRVRVELPGGDEVTGTATRLSPDGALVVVDDTGTERHVRAGDVRHIRAT
ncbi:MAG: biotin--[acetyl-CoA-carboxylase] ligase [Cellulomonas sp.]|uniref:biotin--[acetyl-CoA-carboxylase] ligase n=1 Tax=Cellulomonas sp. TaxID=40001 RepID=UPI001846FDE8|nr:biotin--[acetyl-CoA-carboxylase] ligase [Cellulomonas sp.]NMM31984.1 biotin--[acetyl-CoA-carboxylase] ligase [Cellulomonas sp.]